MFYINVSRIVHDICSSVNSAFIFKIKSSIFGNFDPIYVIVDEKMIYIHIQGGITDVSAKTQTLLVKLRGTLSLLYQVYWSIQSENSLCLSL